MLISFSDLKSLPVFTRMGTHLGKVSEILIDSNFSVILKYEVKRGRVSGQKYLISKEQIIEINKEKIIVSDEVVTELAKETSFRKAPKNVSPALTSKIN